MQLVIIIKGRAKLRKNGLPRKQKSRLFKREYAPLYLMAAPAFVYLLIFCYAPMVGVVIAFEKFNVQKGFFGSEFVGFDNFKFLFATTDVFNITRNTVLYFFAYQAAGLAVSMTAALMLSMLRSARTAKVFQTFYLMPYFLSWTVVAAAVNALISTGGFIDQFLRALGAAPFSDSWYMTRSLWPPFLTFISTWKAAGYSTVLFLAVISGIPVELYEAAMVDGASKWRQAWHITLPQLRFIVTISLIMAMGSIVRGDFGLHFTVTRDTGYLYPVTDIIDTYIFRGLKMGNIGMSTAVGLFQSAVGLVMILASNWIVNRVDPERAMF